MKQKCLKMYLNGIGFRGIERVKGVHHTIIFIGSNTEDSVVKYIHQEWLNKSIT
ncbi:IS1 transposase [Nostoc sp. NIES-2111]|nr:IS1 transposase [Nostoc sp. NIES-2111]